MIFWETISIWKWFFFNDLLPQKMISGCFLRKKMIYRCEKSFPSSSEMIFYTRKWFRRNSKMIFVKWFLEHFVPVLKMWFTLGKKTISFGNGHFRKWTEIIFFQKMLDNLRNFCIMCDLDMTKAFLKTVDSDLESPDPILSLK